MAGNIDYILIGISRPNLDPKKENTTTVDKPTAGSSMLATVVSTATATARGGGGDDPAGHYKHRATVWACCSTLAAAPSPLLFENGVEHGLATQRAA
jgi:hypothetical protein